MKYTKIFNLIIFIITILIFYIPIAIIILYSFNSSRSVEFENLSFKWYKELFMDSERLWSAVKMSILVGITSSITSTFLGCLGAWAIWHKNNKIRKFLLALTYMPLILPDLIIGVSLLTLFVMTGIPLGIGTIFIAHTTMNIPFALLLTLSILEDSDMSVLEAAKDLGANEIQTWIRIILPIISPGLIASFLLTLTLSLDDFAITFFVSGPGATTLPVYIYSAIRFGLSPAINALSVLIIGTSIILFSLNKRYMKIAFK